MGFTDDLTFIVKILLSHLAFSASFRRLGFEAESFGKQGVSCCRSPEAGTLETGKSYREKKAKPLIKKIVTVLRSVYRAYLDLSRRFSDMQKSYEKAWGKVNSLTARVEELWNENRALRERLGDFDRVERALGRDTVETIVQKEKRLEEIQRMQKQRQKRKIDRGER